MENVIDYDRDAMDIRNLEAIGRGTGARFLRCIEGLPERGDKKVYIAKRWARNPVWREGEVMIRFA